MPIQFEVDTARRLRKVVFSEHITEREFVKYGASLSPDKMSQYDISYIDLSKMTGCDLDYHLVAQHADRSISRENSFIEIICALSDLAYGFGRMYQTLSGDSIDVRLFNNEKAALEELEKVLSGLGNTE